MYLAGCQRSVTPPLIGIPNIEIFLSNLNAESDVICIKDKTFLRYMDYENFVIKESKLARSIFF